jgi:2-methylisocitrate lyase-like PEP mutase family enzyme
MYSPDEAASPVGRALNAARNGGVPDFVVNARCDTLVMGGKLEEVIGRGKKYLEAGATTIFVWGGSKRGVSRDEVEQMVKAFDGRLNVPLKWDKQCLSVAQLAELGVARISVGPTITFFAMAEYERRARELLEQAK